MISKSGFCFWSQYTSGLVMWLKINEGMQFSPQKNPIYARFSHRWSHIPNKINVLSFSQTSKKYMELYSEKRKDEGYSDTIVHTLAFDAVWALAIALNRTASQLDEMDYRNSDILECSKLQGSLNVSLDQFEYSNAQLACLLKKNMQRTLFDGVSVSG